MTTTRRSRRDGTVAATAALFVNAWMAWGLWGLLSFRDEPVTAAPPLQVVLIAAAPRPQLAVLPVSAAVAKATAPRAADPRPAPADATRVATPPAPPLAEESAPARPMSAVYLQQARQWAQQHPQDTPPADPFANRPVALAQQSRSRFRLADPRSPANALAKVGKLFGGADYTTDDCALIRQRMLGQVVGGEAAAVQQDLDYERRHCRP